MLQGVGFTSQLGLLSWLTGLTEVGGSALILLGLFMPLAAVGLLGAGASVVVSKWSGGFFEGQGFELELTFASIALALLLTGPGRLALDVKRPWRRRPVPYGVAGMALAGVISIITLVLFREHQNAPREARRLGAGPTLW